MSGHSGAPLARKLGIRSGHVVLLVNAPDGFEGALDGLPADVEVRRDPGGPADAVVSFHTERATALEAPRSRRRRGGHR